MSKISVVLFATILSSVLSYAQQSPSKSEFRSGKYTVRIINNPDNTFGYEILEDGETKLKQAFKPFISRPMGFIKKENAMLYAKWHLEEVKNGREVPRFTSPNKAKELGITNDDLIVNSKN